MKIRSTSKSPTQLFGELSNGSKVYSHEISNSNGMTLKVMDYGATVIALKKTLKNWKEEQEKNGGDQFAVGKGKGLD